MDIFTITTSGVNCYLLNYENNYIIIDTGVPNKRSTLEDILRSKGCIEGKLKLIILTHSDSDHSGNANYLKKIYKTKIAMHKNDEIGVQSGKLAMVRDIPKTISGFFVNLIIGLFDLSPPDRFTPDITFIDEIEILDIGIPIKTVNLHGHTFGSIGLVVNGRECICGDFLGNRKKPSKGLGINNHDEFVENVHKLKKLGVEKIYPGHGQPFSLNELVI